MSDLHLVAEINQGHCPDCGYRGFVLGPMGGAAQNIECGNIECRSRFNVTVYGSEVLMVQRIGTGGVDGSIWNSEPQG
jgi:hypothetical protein